MRASESVSILSVFPLRLYEPADLEALVRLDAVCFASEFLFSRRSMRSFAEARNGRTVVAERGRAVVGFAIAHLERVGAEVVGYCVTLDVSPAERRLGLGGDLLRELERWAEVSGARSMMLHVHTGNTAARRFYEARGYGVVREVRGFYRRGVDALECRKELGRSVVCV